MRNAVPSRRQSLSVAVLVAAIAATLGWAAPARAAQGPALGNFTLAVPYGVLNPTVSPRGADDFSCKPSAAHPRPVVLVHGTFANRFNSFAALSPALKRAGYCVFSLNYGASRFRGIGVYGMRSIRGSAAELAAYVDRVRAATGAPQVDLVGYSQGAVVARAYLRWNGGATADADGGAAPVNALVGLSGVNHGTTLLGIATAVDALGLTPLAKAAFGAGPFDLVKGSALQRELAAGPETEPNVQYTMLATQTDEVSIPSSDAFLEAAPGQKVDNVLLQRGCPTDLSDHFNITYSPRAIALVLRALDPADRRRVPCGVVVPFI